MSFGIEHQTQLLHNSCVSACLSMALGDQQQKVIDEFHEDYMAGEIHPSEYLNEKGVKINPATFGKDFALDSDRTWVYFLTVPSLNVVGGLHQVLLIWNKDWDAVYDPAKGFSTQKGKKGRKQRKFYTRQPNGSFALPLKNYVIDFVVDSEQFINYRRNRANETRT